MAKSKLMDAWTTGTTSEEVKSKEEISKRGRPKNDKAMITTTIKFYDDNYYYMEYRAKLLKAEGIGDGTKTSYINWLIEQDKKKNFELADKIKSLF